MKALTLWQPWASAIALGHKRIETRSWATSYRGPLAIHAAVRKFQDISEQRLAEQLGIDLRGLPFGAVVAFCQLIDCLPVEAIADRALSGGGWGPFPAGERSWGNYEPGRFGWILADAVAVEPPVPARGRQGLWEWTP